MTKNRPQDREGAQRDPSALPHGSLGAWLRHQREARGVSLREIADASKISLRYLEALEQDRFDVLPAPVFARGFLREYARVVGLDPDEAVNLYLIASTEIQPSGAPPAVAPPPPKLRRPAAPSTLGYGLLLALAVVVFLGVAALLSYYAGQRNQRPSHAVAPEVAVAYATPGTEESAVSLAPTPTAGPPAATPIPVAPVDRPLSVSLEFAEDCWVELVIDGRRRASELRAGGETLQLEAEDSILLTLGNAPAVRVEVDGRPIVLPVNSARVVRDFRIDRATRARVAPAG